jgi:tetratricopeptide (TPR) repeat protein/tRNA A-37 threonylcarbamoyl transferase component Bud32
MLDRLGGGGMGVVYAAYDPELDRKIAIKLVRASAISEARDRLLREAQAMARLSHPNVIAVHDVGTVDDEVFIAMELVDGDALSKLIKEQPRAQDELLSLFLQAGRGLAAAHGAGIIHRDFKPDNVLVGKDGRARVLDFGLARAAGEDDSKAAVIDVTDETDISGQKALASPLTRTGAFMGTPAYMAPEQMTGKATDARTDQFSFCVALYEALYGERPFGGDTMVALAHNVLNGDLRPVPKDSKVPARLRSALLRGLSAKPDDRFPSMEALLEALAPRPQPVSPVSPVWWAALGVVLLGAGVLGFRSARRQSAALCRGAETQLASIWNPEHKQAVHAAFAATGKPYAEDAFHGVERALDAYASAWMKMHTDACEATRVRGEQSEELLDLRMECLGKRREDMGALVDLFTRADAQVAEKAIEAAHALGGLEGCADTAALKAPVRPPSDPTKRARVDDLRKRLAIVHALSDAGKYADGLAIARMAAGEARTLGYAPVEAEALLRLGGLLRTSGKYKEAEETLLASAAAAAAGRDDAVGASAWTALMKVVGEDEAQPAEALRWSPFAEAALGHGGTEELRAHFYVVRADVLADQQSLDAALLDYHRALTILEKLGPEHPDIATVLGGIGAVLVDQGRPDEALVQERRSLAVLERTLGPDHPALARTLNNVGVALFDLGRYEEALVEIRRALQITERALGPDHHLVGIFAGNVADGLAHLHRYEEALGEARRALAIDEKALGAQHPDLGYPLAVIGNALLGLHQADRAIAPLERSLALWEHGGSTPKDVAEVRFSLARALWETANRGRAIKLAQAAREGYRQSGPVATKRIAEIEAWLEQHRTP